MGGFRRFLESGNTVGVHNDGPGGAFGSGGGGYIDGVWGGQETPETMGLSGHPPHLGGTDIFVPTVTKEGTITGIDYRQSRQNVKKVPSSIAIDVDGIPMMYVTRDELDRIKRRNNLEHAAWKDLVNRRICIVFLRHPNDKTQTMSQVQDVRIY